MIMSKKKKQLKRQRFIWIKLKVIDSHKSYWMAAWGWKKWIFHRNVFYLFIANVHIFLYVEVSPIFLLNVTKTYDIKIVPIFLLLFTKHFFFFT